MSSKLSSNTSSLQSILETVNNLAEGSSVVTPESIVNALGYVPLKSTGWNANKNLGTDENGNVIEKDDVSVTHSWSDTTLTITSASGTSSANLKGDPGYTPVRGTDYWTAEDQASMVQQVLAALPDASEVSY